MMRCIAFVLLFVLAPAAKAQTSAYEDQLVDNLARVDAWHAYLRNYPSRPNLPPTGDVAELATAVAQVYAAFHDQHISEHEERLKAEFDEMVIAGLVSHYPVLSDRLAATKAVLSAGRAADPTDYDFQLARLTEMVEWHYFALPLLLYKGPTPYHQMYRSAQEAYRTATGKRPPELDLTSVDWPNVAARDLGSTEVVSISERRRREADQRRAERAALAQDIDQANAANQARIAEEVSAAQAAAQAEVARELARAQQVAVDLSAEDSSGSSFVWLVLLAAVAAGAALAYRRGWLNRQILDRAPDVLAATQKLSPLNLKKDGRS
ncbi:MAG: hypothetical protein AAGB27_06095 [Pseudomonadota bacterium]